MGESPGPVPCRGCGGALEAEAKFCARCGRSRDLTDATMIELRPLGMGATFEQTAIVTTRPPDRKRTLSLLGAVALIALVAFALTKLFGGDSADEATAPTSTVPATTTIPETTTFPPTTAAPATTAPRTTTSLAPPATTTTIPYVNQRQGVVLDAAQNGRSIYLISGQDLYRMELGSGRVTSRRLTGSLGGYGVMGVLDGRLLLSGVSGQNLGWIAADLSGEVTGIDTAGFGVNGQGSVAPDGVWVLRQSNETGAAALVRRLDLKGTVRAEVQLPAGTYPAGYLGDRVVVSQFGRIWTVGTDSVPVPYAVGQLVTSQFGLVLWVSCDDKARCTFHLGDATKPDTGRTSLETSFLGAWGANSEFGMAWNALSPDGATLVGQVMADSSTVRQKIVDLATGSALELSGPGYSSYAWTTSGDWLIESTLGGELVATNVRTGSKKSLIYAQAFPARNTAFNMILG